MSFLPETYEAPKSNNMGYAKLLDGENKFRILSKPIYGWEDWTAEKKPVRFRYNEKPDRSINPKMPIRHFWAMIVWNYTQAKIQVLQLTQATLRKELLNLSKNEDWGAPFFYDIKIIKSGVQKETEYSLTPCPLKDLSPHIIEEFKATPCYLEALFENGDPFSPEWNKYTPGEFDKAAISSNIIPINAQPPISKGVTLDEANELACTLDQCEPSYKETVWQALQTNGIAKLIDLTPEMYDRVKKAAIKKSTEYQNQNLPF